MAEASWGWRSFKHIEALWFSNVANSLMWWTYVKAFWRAANSLCGGGIQFKTTIKGASALMNSGLRDLLMPIIAFGLLLSAIIAGCVKIFSVRVCSGFHVPGCTCCTC